jgi:hypothetical protein
MRDMSVSEALQETIADLSFALENSFEPFTQDALRDAITTIEGALSLLGSASNVRPSDKRRRVPVRKAAKKKRKKSAYQTWADKERPKIIKQHPRFSFGRVNQELGKRWKREKKKRGIK